MYKQNFNTHPNLYIKLIKKIFNLTIYLYSINLNIIIQFGTSLECEFICDSKLYIIFE